MSSHDADAIKKEVRGYFVIFSGLMTLSLSAVALYYLQIPLAWAIVLTLIIATTQVFLAAGYFMHLLSERRMLIYIVLSLTAIFAIAVLFLPIITQHDPINGTVHGHVS